MDLVNTTPVPAALRLGPLPGTDRRVAAVLAKATFRIGEGAPELETQEPVPLFDQDVETDLGLVPRDDLVRHDEAFEVVLIGAAYAPGGRPAPETTVALAVGGVRHELDVVGDRYWVGTGGHRFMTQPEPFVRMPMTWSRAFGGTAEVLIDEEAVVEVADVRNRQGRGFDREAAMAGLVEGLAMPPGYPVLLDAESLRQPPNLESPYAPVTRPTDAPDPLCWAALPMDSGLHALRVLEGVDLETATAEEVASRPALLYRAHPQWVLPAPPPERAPVTLQNGTPGGLLATALPALRVVFDYVNDGRTATRDLAPQMLVLYADEGRMTITYRKGFTLPFRAGTERGLRLRTEAGWYRPPPASPVRG